MTSTVALIDELRGRGVEFAVAGERLHWRAPRGAMTPGLVDALRQHKGEVMALLENDVDDAGLVDESVLAGHAWDAETTQLIRWFLGTEPPSEPFELERAVTIAHPGEYWEYLIGDSAAGPGKGRSYYGAFEANLRRLYQLFGPGRQGCWVTKQTRR